MKHIMRAPLILLLAVHFIFAHNWENNPSDYELQMTMTGVILINNENSVNDDYFILTDKFQELLMEKKDES